MHKIIGFIGNFFQICCKVIRFIPGVHGSYQWKEGDEFGDAIIPKSNVNTVAHKPTCRKASIEAAANNRFCQIVHPQASEDRCAGSSSSRQTPWPSKRRASAILLACVAVV